MARLLFILSVLLALALPPGAIAGAVIPATESLPWTDPAHNSPLEQLASGIASQIAGRPVRAYCNGQTDWDVLARGTGFDGAAWWGYVGSPRYWYPTTRTFAESSTHMQLAPIACEHLWRFAKAEVKPTMCSATRIDAYPVRVRERYRAWRRVQVRRSGHLKVVRRQVWRTRYVTRERRRETSLPPVPCYQPLTPSDVILDRPVSDYWAYVGSIWTLAHESIHLADLVSGASVDRVEEQIEARADCYGLQRLAEVATRLGADQGGAVQLALYAWEVLYPRRTDLVSPRGEHYWSSECRPGGNLDLNPATPAWPTG